MVSRETLYDAIVVGGGPAGATAAETLARNGRRVALLDRQGRIKPCGGAVPPRLLEQFTIPEELVVARIGTARVIAPSSASVDMVIDGGSVGMVDREHFDAYLRDRAARSGAVRLTGRFRELAQLEDGTAEVVYEGLGNETSGALHRVRARCIIGADGARSAVAAQAMPAQGNPPCVFAYHEVIEAPSAGSGAFYGAERCDVYYQGHLSPDFYAWVFPHGATASVGVGSAQKGFSLRGAVRELRATSGLDASITVRREGAPIPLRPLRRWDNRRNVVLAGDAAGVVAPASGEGIYYAMLTGQFAAEAAEAFLETGRPQALAMARKRFMREHGRVFWILGILQHFWYRNDRRRERFVAICRDPDVQRLTWQSYMHKKLSRANPLAHVRIFLNDLAHLLGMRPI
ncbi:MAG: geranylgeranyl diphosphate reductase [Rhizobiales bacterium]|nr:geranylgeranyl diphosphate reductase [Hyphomicrobiales bacterium]